MLRSWCPGNKLSFGQLFGLIIVKWLTIWLILIDVVLVLQGGETIAMRFFNYRVALKSSFDKPHGPWPRR